MQMTKTARDVWRVRIVLIRSGRKKQLKHQIFVVITSDVESDFHIRGTFKRFCNLTIKKNGNVTNYTIFFNIISTEFSAFATFFWQIVNSTKIEIFCLSFQTASFSILSSG